MEISQNFVAFSGDMNFSKKKNEQVMDLNFRLIEKSKKLHDRT